MLPPERLESSGWQFLRVGVSQESPKKVDGEELIHESIAGAQKKLL